MTNLNMAKVNMLIKKVYLLAGVVMAANMFAVNEMKAMNSTNNIYESNPDNIVESKEPYNKKDNIPGASKIQFVQNITNKVLSYENIINLFGGLAFSCVNNYFKWWDYNPGWYGQFGCFGWKSKRFLYDVVQFEFNFNLGRGALWSFIHIINREKTSGKVKKTNNNFSLTSFFLKDILRGFTSMPLTFHISKFNFSISLSLDSIIWAGIDHFILKKLSDKKGKKTKKGPKKDGNNVPNMDANPSENNSSNQPGNNNPEENSFGDTPETIPNN